MKAEDARAVTTNVIADREQRIQAEWEASGREAAFKAIKRACDGGQFHTRLDGLPDCGVQELKDLGFTIQPYGLMGIITHHRIRWNV